MVQIENLTDQQIEKLIKRLNELIELGLSVDENNQKLQVLVKEKELREVQKTGVIPNPNSNSELAQFMEWRDGDAESSGIPTAMVVDDITITSNTVRIKRSAIALDRTTPDPEEVKNDIKIVRKKRNKSDTSSEVQAPVTSPTSITMQSGANKAIGKSGANKAVSSEATGRNSAVSGRNKAITGRNKAVTGRNKALTGRNAAAKRKRPAKKRTLTTNNKVKRPTPRKITETDQEKPEKSFNPMIAAIVVAMVVAVITAVVFFIMMTKN